MTNNKKIPRVYHTLLFSIFPILFLFSANINSLNYEEVIFPLIVVPIVVLGMWAALNFILKNKLKAGLIISLGIVLFFSYGHIHNILLESELVSDISRHRYLLLPFFTAFIIGTIYFVKTKRLLNNATTITNGISFALVIMTLVSIGSFGFADTSLKLENQETNLQEIQNKANLPDIYYIILDGYAGAEILRDVYDFDNTEFISFLKQNNFYVIENAHSNYAITSLSLSSSLNMNYLDSIIEELLPDNRSIHPINQIISNNKVMRDLKTLGYEIVVLASSQKYTTDLEVADTILCEEFNTWSTEFNVNLVKTSILKPIYVMLFETHRDKIECSLDTLLNVSEQFDVPIVVWAHLLLPHPPYLFGPNGEHVESDTIEITDSWGDGVGYINQVMFANKKMTEFVESVKNNETQPIILIQGDHGSGGASFTGLTDEKIRQRMTILSSMHLPGEIEFIPYDGITPVNSFRLIFNNYFDTNYEFLPDKSYFGNHKNPYDLKNVTEILQE